MELTIEEQEIIKRFRQLSDFQKKAILSSENSFIEWLKEVARWIWEKLIESYEFLRIFEDLRRLFFG